MSTCGGLMDFFPANFMLQVPNNDQNDQQPPHGFHGVAPMLGKRTTPFSGMDGFYEEGNGGEDGDNLSDDGFQLGEKKRRLSLEQVRTLEKSFELGNKLEPERKIQLAKALGLKPRQVAIWFQNRRARWKTKQLEKDYVILKRQFEALKVDNESILVQNHKLQSEISTLKGKNPTERINLNKETDQGSCSTRSENSSDIKRDISTTTTTTTTTAHMYTEGNRSAFFTQPPSSSYTVSRANGPTARLFQNPPDLHCQRLDQSVREEGFTNMFPGMDDHSGFWPWVDHHNYS